MNYKELNHDSLDCITFINEILSNDSPYFLGRIGGSDYDAVSEYYANKDILKDAAWYDNQLYRLKRFNGYFDFSDDTSLFKKYFEDMISYYKSMDSASFCNDNIIQQFNRKKFTHANSLFLSDILNNKTVFCYDFIQHIIPFRSTFEHWAKDKTILIVSPLSESIQHQWNNRKKLFKNFSYPNMTLKTFNTSITYSNAGDSKDILDIKTDNWHQECLRLGNEIAHIDFDVALLSCASYSMFLGNFIKNSLKKKAVYLGGCLNVYFNIYGGRYGKGTIWENIYDQAGCDLDYQIDPLENSKIDKIKSGRGKQSESLGAYFGSRDGRFSHKKKKR